MSAPLDADELAKIKEVMNHLADYSTTPPAEAPTPELSESEPAAPTDTAGPVSPPPPLETSKAEAPARPEQPAVSAPQPAADSGGPFASDDTPVAGPLPTPAEQPSSPESPVESVVAPEQPESGPFAAPIEPDQQPEVTEQPQPDSAESIITGQQPESGPFAAPIEPDQQSEVTEQPQPDSAESIITGQQPESASDPLAGITPWSAGAADQPETSRLSPDGLFAAPVDTSPTYGPEGSPGASSGPFTPPSPSEPAVGAPAAPTAPQPEPVAVAPGPGAVPVSSTVANEPSDILYAIATRGATAGNAAAETVMTARQEAQQLAPEKTLRKKAASRVKFEALDFDSIVPQHPLVIASYSPSGGVGKSSTAMNLGILIATVAENMAQQKGPDARVPRVLTLDGDIVMGSLSLRLTSKVEPNLYDLQKYIDQRTAAGFQGDAAWPPAFDSAPPGEEPMYKFTHWPDSPSNFSVLAAPSDPSHFWHFGPDHYRNILRMLGRFYDVIIIDCGTDLVLDSQRAWLSHANEVFMITSPDSDRLYNCAKAARIIASAGPHPQDRRPKEEQKNYPPLATREKLSLVVTRYDSDSGLKLDLLVDKLFPWLDEDQKFWIPDVSQDMTRANNTGRFLVKENQEYADVINRMAKHAFHRYVSSRSQRDLAING